LQYYFIEKHTLPIASQIPNHKFVNRKKF